VDKSPEALRYAVRLAVLARYGGRLCVVVGAVTGAPLLVALFCGEAQAALRYAAVAAALLVCGFASTRLKDTRRVQANEAMVLAVAAFLLATAAMVIPWMAEGIGFGDAAFEAVSAVTTTGLTTLADLGSRTESFLFARAWMQWCGGLGFVVMSLVLFHPLGTAAKDLAVTEDIRDDLVGGAKAFASKIFRVYVALSVLAFLSLLLAGGSFRDAVLYALAAVSTGGFAPRAGSLTGTAGPAFNGVVMLTCLAGSFPLILYFRLSRGRALPRDHSTQAAAIVACGLAIALGVAHTVWSTVPGGGLMTLYHSAMLAFSSQTTAGFSTLDPASLPAGAKAALILGMAVGGGMGSTAGGFKIQRLLIAARLVQLLVYRTSLSHHAAVFDRYAGRRLDEAEIRTGLLVIILFCGVAFVSWTAFLAAGFGPLDSLFEVVSATGTVGLSTGVTSAELPAGLKFILCVDMLLGRLEFIAFLVCLSPHCWIGRRRQFA
jgi:trk system potassium uptake protein